MERYQTARVFKRDATTGALENTGIIVEFTPRTTTLGEMKQKVAKAARDKGHRVKSVKLYAYDHSANTNILGKDIDERHSDYVVDIENSAGGARRRRGTRRSNRQQRRRQTRRK